MRSPVFIGLAMVVFMSVPAFADVQGKGTMVTPYGYIKFDAAYDQARIDGGNYARWVESEATREDDNQFNTTANNSRFGFKLRNTEFRGTRASGRVELDFYGGGAENNPNPMMRHAYVQVDWPESDFSILAGQTSDVISPLVPNTLNYAVAWWAGDIGYRHPQLRLTKGFGQKDHTQMVFQAAAVRTIGDAVSTSPGDTGEDAGYPSLQGRLAFSLPSASDNKTSLGFSGHYGKEEYDYDALNHSVSLDTWSANLDLTLPIGKTLTFRGELWQGENLDAYLGGVAQGVVIETDSGKYTNAKDVDGDFVSSWSVRSRGGWASLSFGPYDKWLFNLGGSMDDPEDADLQDGDRSKNVSTFWNCMYNVTDAVQFGFEVSYWKTDYKNLPYGDSYRVQQSLAYSF